MKMALSLLFVFSSTIVFAGTQVQSKNITVNPSHITDRVELINNQENDGVLVQVIAEKLAGSTDYSNTHRIILSISQISEMATTEASFVVARSRGLTSAKLLSNGTIELVYTDANTETPGQDKTITIDTSEAMNQVQHGTCEEFATCKMATIVTIK